MNYQNHLNFGIEAVENVGRNRAVAQKGKRGMSDDWEQRTREALTWAIGETPIRLPEALLDASGWEVDDPDSSLYANIPEGAFRFHVEMERCGSRRTRIAVMTMNTRGGTRVDWQAPIPPRS